MTTEKMITEMVKLQIGLNEFTNGKKWIEGVTRTGAIINWGRCIYMETMELIDSFPWKHWKDVNATPDIENIKIELVDIWHFVISLQIESLYRQGEKNYIENAIERLVEAARINEGLDKSIIESRIDSLTQKEVGNSEYIKTIETLIYLGTMASDKSDKDVYIVSSNTIPKIFFIVLNELGFSNHDLYKLYLMKNVLNIFRQQHGYANGQYNKIWNGKEDNEVLTQIMNEVLDFDADLLLEKLEKEYAKVKGSPNE